MAATFLAALGVSGRLCTVVGGDEEAARRARALASEGARVQLRWRERTAVLDALVGERSIEVIVGALDPEAIVRVSFVTILAPRDPSLAAALFAVADREGKLLCAVDQPEHCTFAHVAVTRAGPVRVGVSTSGAAPLLARRIREGLERAFDARFAAFAERVAEARMASPPGTRLAATEPLLEGFSLHVTVHLPDR